MSGEVCGCGHALNNHGDDGCHAMDGNFAPCYCVPSTSEGEGT